MLIALALLAAPRASAEPRPVVLVLLNKDTPELVSDRSFALALDIQLQAQGVKLRQRRWIPPADPSDQPGRAGQRGRAAGADFVAWYQLDTRGAAPAVLVFLLQLEDGQPETRFINLGPPQEGIERAMALTLRTMISAGLGGSAPVGEPATPAALAPEVLQPATQPSPQLPQPAATRPAAPATAPAAPPAPAPPPATAPALSPAPPTPASSAHPPRLTLAGGYNLSLLPLGETLRHGPWGRFKLRLWRELSVSLEAGWGIAPGGTRGAASWSQDALDLAVALTHSWLFSPRWTVDLGGQLRLSNVRAEASAPGDRQERASLWELGLGPTLGAAFEFNDFLTAELQLLVAWLPVGHELLIGGDPVADSGGLLLALQAGARFGLW